MTREIPTRDVDVADWLSVHEAARTEGFRFFDFVTAVDETDRVSDDAPAGFDVISHLYDHSERELRSVMHRTRLPFNDGDSTAPTIASLTRLWRGAAWHERETFEMFGIVFDGFEDGTGQELRKLLLPDTFSGTPLRKSFVLTARASKEWPGIKEPGESKGEAKSENARGAKRRKVMAPGVPDDTWGPR